MLSLARKSALVLCMDVGFSMSNSAPGEEPPFAQAKKVIQKFVQRQVFAETKDELALVLFGTDSTKNSLDQDGQYQNITVHRHLMVPDFELLEEIEHQIHPENQQADWLDALVVSMDLLQTETKGKKCDRLNIVLLTDLNTEASSDKLDVIIENLKQAGITLQFFLPFPVEDEEEGEGDEDRTGSGDPGRGKGLSREQRIGPFKAVLLHFIYSLAIFKCYSTLIIVTEEKLKKMWITVDAQTNQRDDVKRETVFCLDDDNETEVQKEDIIQGFRYGSDIVPFSKVDQDQMKYKHDGKCFAVLGFTKKNLVLRHQFMGTQIVKIFPARDDEHAGVAMSALIRGLDELNMVAIVRYAYDRRSNPQVGAAFPCIKPDYECLLYVQLPFMEDLYGRQFTFPSLENNKKIAPSGTQLSAIDSLIDSMMLVTEDEDLLKPHHLPNPAFQRHFQCLHHRAVHADSPLPPMEPWLEAALDRPEVIQERCQAPLQEIKKLFPLTEVEKKKKLKTSAQIFGKDSEEPDAKKAKEDEEEDEYNLANIAEGSVTSVRVRGNWLICQQLTHRIEQLLSNKNTHYYMKSITCIQAFREQSVKQGNADLFNSYLQSLKRSIPSRGLEVFWDLLVQGTISLFFKRLQGFCSIIFPWEEMKPLHDLSAERCFSYSTSLLKSSAFDCFVWADAVTLISKDKVEGSAVSKSEASQVILMHIDIHINSVEYY
uniref:X-ray repair cross-complementing protein 5 n=1 Tax=Xiphophorus couchianus TaxID=32473 RepID=A0A3B5KTE5_9TELE